MMIRKMLLLGVSVLLLSACGSSRNVVIDPVREAAGPFASVQLKEGESTIDLAADDKAYFEEKMSEYLSPHFVFGTSNELHIVYSFIGFEEGSRGKRWLAGGIGNWGEGSLVIQTQYMTADGKILSTINTDASISGGFFGGDIESTFKKAARKLSDYTIQQFAANKSKK